MEDPFDLQRFVDAQRHQIDSVRAELAEGNKRGHWIWFVFPQMRGLGQSWTANRYGIGSRAEAEAYLRHPVLGPRLVECTDLVNRVNGYTAEQIFDELDAMKFRSSMTLFGEADRNQPAFAEALNKYFGGERDSLTLDLLRAARSER